MENMEKEIRTIIVQSCVLTRKITKYMCSVFKNLKVCGDFDNAEDALAFISDNSIDLVILDMRLPRMSGIEAANIIKYINPNVKIIMTISDDEQNSVIISSILADVNAYTLKDFDYNKLKHIISTIFNDEYWFDFRFQYSIFESLFCLPKNDYNYFKSLLTAIETSLISCVLKGFTNDEISTYLDLKGKELALYTKSIFKKLAKTSFAELMLRSTHYDLF